MNVELHDRGHWTGQRVLVLSPTPTHPQDFGNRKRIFEVCRTLRDAGAEITFIHYPAETEWRQANPWSAERAMVAAWTQYYTVPASRDLHTAPKGTHHEIDEWWDDAIGVFLRWLFSVQTFDVFIVNYAWLSKAFEFAPPSIVKILDTHDKKSGRRELLTANGIAAEYFFTTEPQEKIAFNRADLIWAIKDEERAVFEKMTTTPVITIPHLDPAHRLTRPEPDPEGYLRVGFLAARNNINRVNVTNFLRIAEPIFTASFAPIKLVIGGSICDYLAEMKPPPFVELRGRVPSADAFYESVDCAVIPMTFSTGLKIKTVEAISAGMPVVSTAHAFEGFQPADRMHTLADFPALAQALVDLAFAPRSQLDDLSTASTMSHLATARLIDASFGRTLDHVRKNQHSVVLAVDSRAFVPGTVFNLVLKSVHAYLRVLGNVSVLVVKGSAAHLIDNESLADQIGRVLIARDLDDVEASEPRLNAMHAAIVDVEDFLARKHVKVLIADALHDAFYKPCCSETTVFVRAEIIALGERTSSFHFPGEAFRRAFAVTARPARDVAAGRAMTNASMILAPCINRAQGLIPALKPKDGSRIVLLGSPQTRGMALANILAESWRMKPMTVIGVDRFEDDGREMAGGTRAEAFVEDLIRGNIAAPLFAVDLSGGQLGLQLCREVLERLGVPVVTAGSVGLHRSLGVNSLPSTVATEFELSEVFRAFAIDPEMPANPAFSNARAYLDSDRGWAYIWGFCKRLFATRDPEFA